MKTVIIYYSRHHGNTKKLLDAIAAVGDVTLIDATQTKEADLSGYDLIGFASGIYYGKFHQTVTDFAKACLPSGKNTFVVATYGGTAPLTDIKAIISEKNCTLAGTYTCKGFDTFGPFKLVGGLCKGHPTEDEIGAAADFYRGLCK